MRWLLGSLCLLGSAVFAAAPALTQEEISKLAYQEVLGRLSLFTRDNGSVDYSAAQKHPQIATDAALALAQKLVDTGYSPDRATNVALSAVAEREQIRDSCKYTGREIQPKLELNPPKPEPETEEPDTAAIRQKFGIGGEICGYGLETLKSMDQSRDEIRSKLKLAATPEQPKPENEPRSDDKAPESRQVSIGPSMGSGSDSVGTASSGFSLSGHRTTGVSDSGPQNDEVFKVSATPKENIEAVRQALQQKILSREVSPAIAAKILREVSPLLTAEPSLSAALAKADQKLAAVVSKPAPINTVAMAAEKQASALDPIPTEEAVPKTESELIASWNVFALPGTGVATAESPEPLNSLADKNQPTAVEASILGALAKSNALPTDLIGDTSSSPTSLATDSGFSFATAAAGVPAAKAGTIKPEAYKKTSSWENAQTDFKQPRGKQSRHIASHSNHVRETSVSEPFAPKTLARPALYPSPRELPDQENPWLAWFVFFSTLSMTVAAFLYLKRAPDQD